MTRIESKTVSIARNRKDVQDFAQDLNNFEKLLPKDRISDFKSDGESCSFKIQGLSTIGLRKEEVSEGRILLKSTEAPFSFQIDVKMEEEGDGTKAYQIVDLDLNPMMKMMVEKPLRNLFDHIADRLQAEMA